MLLVEKLKVSQAYLIQDLVLLKIILLSVSQKQKTGTDSSMIFFLCSKMDFTIDLIVLSSSNTNKAAIAGPNPPIMCRIVPRGWENEITLRLVNAASPHHAIHEIRNVIIRNLASLLVFNLVYPPSQLLHPQPTSQPSCLALFFPGLYFFALYFSDLDINTTHSTCMVLGKLSTGRTRVSS